MQQFDEYQNQEWRDIDEAFDSAEHTLLVTYNKDLESLKTERQERKNLLLVELSQAANATLLELQRRRNMYHHCSSSDNNNNNKQTWTQWVTSLFFTSYSNRSNHLDIYTLVDNPVPPSCSSYV